MFRSTIGSDDVLPRLCSRALRSWSSRNGIFFFVQLFLFFLRNFYLFLQLLANFLFLFLDAFSFQFSPLSCRHKLRPNFDSFLSFFSASCLFYLPLVNFQFVSYQLFFFPFSVFSSFLASFLISFLKIFSLSSGNFCRFYEILLDFPSLSLLLLSAFADFSPF